MKFNRMVLLIFIMVSTACQFKKKTNALQDGAKKEHVKVVEKRFLVIPGCAVGDISVGEEMESVAMKLGKPNVSEAAMGKAWSIWYGSDSTSGIRNEIAIFFTYRDTSLVKKDVKQIRITTDKFTTKDGLKVGDSFSKMLKRFADLKRVKAYTNDKNDTIVIDDALKSGIGFEFLKNRAISITIHPKEKEINYSYLTLYPKSRLINK